MNKQEARRDCARQIRAVRWRLQQDAAISWRPFSVDGYRSEIGAILQRAWEEGLLDDLVGRKRSKRLPAASLGDLIRQRRKQLEPQKFDPVGPALREGARRHSAVDRDTSYAALKREHQIAERQRARRARFDETVFGIICDAPEFPRRVESLEEPAATLESADRVATWLETGRPNRCVIEPVSPAKDPPDLVTRQLIADAVVQLADEIVAAADELECLCVTAAECGQDPSEIEALVRDSRWRLYVLIDGVDHSVSPALVEVLRLARADAGLCVDVLPGVPTAHEAVLALGVRLLKAPVRQWCAPKERWFSRIASAASDIQRKTLEVRSAVWREQFALGDVPFPGATQNNLGVSTTEVARYDVEVAAASAEADTAFRIDDGSFSVSNGGVSCPLGNTIAFRLLKRLARRPGLFVSIDTLFDDVWGGETRTKNNVHKTVSTLRRKMRDAGIEGVEIDAQRNHYALQISALGKG